MSIIRQLARVANRIDSASIGTFLSKGDSTGDFTLVNYTDLSGRPTTLDSAALTSIVDSAYIQLRQTSAGSGGLDSAGITAIVDSNYVVARSPAASSGFANYEYTATAGQTTFQDSDINGNVMSYTADGIFVFYNGVLIAPTTDYTATDGSSVVLTTGADSGSHVAISKWNIASAGAGGASGVWYGDRGLFAGGLSPGSSTRINTIQYIDITTPSNTTDFGDLSVPSYGWSGVSDGTYGVFAGGYTTAYSTTIEYVVTATTGNTTDFGDMTEAKSTVGGGSNGTYGLYGGGSGGSGETNVIEYITIATPSNATDFGDLTESKNFVACFSDASYVVWAGGKNTGGSRVNTMDYVTAATASNATDFGDTLAVVETASGASNDTYGILAGGRSDTSAGNYYNTIQYVTTATPSNSSDFGDLTNTYSEMAGFSNGTRAVFGGSYTAGTLYNIIDYVTIATPSNASDFGDLNDVTRLAAGAAGSPS